MLKEHKRSFGRTFALCDILLVVLAFFLAYYLRFRSFSLEVFHLPLEYKVFLLAYVVGWLYLSRRFRFYVSKRFTPLLKEGLDVLKVSLIDLALATVPSFLLRDLPVSRLFLLYLGIIQPAFSLSFRVVLRWALMYIRRRGYNFRQILIVGQNRRSADFVKRIEESPDLGVRILGFLDAPNKWTLEIFRKYRSFGNLSNLELILRKQVVDEVFLMLPIKSFYAEIEEMVSLCEAVGVEVKIPVNLFNIELARSTISNYGHLEVIDLYTSPRMTWQLMTKRLIDISLSLFLLILLSPVFVITAILVKATSPGPVFFKQQRVGYNGRLFQCLKFRTMIENAEALKKDLLELNELEGPVFKIKNDPRLTQVGRILRKTSIDELPQLINVIKGDMSLVGPRPPVPEEVKEYDLECLRRLSFRPGITCLWQVMGRNAIPFKKWMELDKEYIDNWSLGLDMKILTKTFLVVLRGTGAS
jgi:exopolysaccharide biosynthesis polyprenyl glycosylphosphotransferase